MRRRFGSDTRLRRRAEYDRVRADGEQRHGRRYILQGMLRDDPASRHRLGVIASRRVGNAVVRNRAKRVFRALFRQLPVPEVPPLDWVVVVRSGFDEIPAAELRANFEETAMRLRSRLLTVRASGGAVE